MTTNESKVIVLRFRDIELTAGETIKEHRRVIGKHGHCWWGWLYREYESNPHRAILEISTKLSDDFPVVLYDTGRTRVYVATCDEIRAYPYARRSPSLDLTPGYYNDRPAPIWFRFSEIEDSTDQIVVGKSCIDLPSASDECFTDLLGRTVTHIRDLRRQEVTMWVLQ
ncbi:MAG TPA: hypothetical protein VJ914_26590 [Pseudonocardiaceae bacterium]|nr:hypothetical protein [Pseudonocardiaceae bacterium]